MAEYCTCVRPYFQENTAQKYPAPGRYINSYCACAVQRFRLLLACYLLALHSTSTRTDPCTSGRKHRKSVNNAVFILNESLFVVFVAATSTFQLEHTPRLRSTYPGLRAMKHGLSNKKYYACEYRLTCACCISLVSQTQPTPARIAFSI